MVSSFLEFVNDRGCSSLLLDLLSDKAPEEILCGFVIFFCCQVNDFVNKFRNVALVRIDMLKDLKNASPFLRDNINL